MPVRILSDRGTEFNWIEKLGIIHSRTSASKSNVKTLRHLTKNVWNVRENILFQVGKEFNIDCAKLNDVFSYPS